MALNTPSHLLYLHGFRSSPQSAKARHVAGWMQQHQPAVVWCCPQLPPSPAEAIALLQQLTQHWPQDGSAVIGSSLGGFYATWVAHQARCPSVLLNPAVHPARDLERYIGEQTAWHSPSEHFYFQQAYIDELRAIEQQTLAREAQRLADNTLAPAFALICEGDEVLDWREMQARHTHARQRVLPGNDHAISDFPQHWPELAAFLQLDNTQGQPA